MDLLLWLRDLLTQSLQGMVLELSHLSGAFPADPTSGAVSGQVPQVGEAGQALEPFLSLPFPSWFLPTRMSTRCKPRARGRRTLYKRCKPGMESLG